MRRRDFIKAIAISAAGWPLAARAQQANQSRRIAILMSLPENDPEAQLRLKAIRAELQQRGWTEGINIRIDVRWQGGESELQSLANQLVALRPDIIFAQSTPQFSRCYVRRAPRPSFSYRSLTLLVSALFQAWRGRAATSRPNSREWRYCSTRKQPRISKHIRDLLRWQLLHIRCRFLQSRSATPTKLSLL